MNSGRARRYELIFLILLTLGAFGLRIYRVGAIGLAEDEAGKWLAIQQYRQGHFAAVNSEHPMLMKLLAWGSLAAGGRWNQWAGEHRWPQARAETWLRLPNLFFGAATTLALYLLGRQMLEPVGAGAAAIFWAVSPLSIALNRVLKEETLFTFFTVLAFYFYFRGKAATSDGQARWYFILSGVSFGLDLASSYLAVGQFGLIVLVWHVANQLGYPSRPMGPHFRRLLIAGGAAFLLLNPAILSPKNLRAMTRYSEEKGIQHHGYNLNGKVLLNNALTTPYGLPWYFYFWVLGVKTPLPILAACLAGILLLFRERDSLVSVFLRVMLVFWFVPYSLAGSKWIRYLLIILPSVYLAGGWAVEKLWKWRRRRQLAPAPRAAVAFASLVLLVWPAVAAARWAPYYQLYLNALGGGRTNTGRFFPHDEVYDLGAREAVEYVCGVAPPGATLAASSPMLLSFYLEQLGRQDLRPVALFDPNYVPRPGDYLLVEDARRYLETDGLTDLVARRGPPARQIVVDSVVTARIYRF
jgi:4-amino-4-deoxy-L-arabinose transferase-like glycosyltransferase